MTGCTIWAPSRIGRIAAAPSISQIRIGKVRNGTGQRSHGGSAKVEDYIDVSLLEEIKREGFITAMEQKYKTR